jgi:kynureninase
VVREAGIGAIRANSLALTAYLRELVASDLAGLGFDLATPIEDDRRAGHLALVHPEAPRICRAWIAAGVIADHRPPRHHPGRAYTRLEDCHEAIGRLREIMEGRAYEAYPAGRGLIT